MDRVQPVGERIAIVGVTCSGKSTLALRLAEMYALKYISMDALHWEAGWKPPPPGVFRQRVEEATSGPAWVTDGNYKEVRDLTWGRAQTLIWLDFPLRVAFWRLVHRTLKRIRSREDLFNGNRETWRGAFFSKDSLFLYAIKSHGVMRRAYPDVIRLPVYRHLKVVRLAGPDELEKWLADLEQARQGQAAAEKAG